MSSNNKRPVFLNLTKINMPATAILSIGHRISGVLLFFSIPLFLYLFELSLSNQAGFDQAQSILEHGFFKFILLVLLWGFIHHFLAGIRFLLLDLDIGMNKKAANKGAWLIHISEIVILFFVVFIIL